MKYDRDIYVFKGSTKQALDSLQEDIKELREEVRGLNRRINVLFIIAAVAFVERVPQLISTVLAAF